MSNAERAARRAPTRAEYEALLARVEDLEDALVLRNAVARGPTADALPVELVERMLAGEHPVRIWREHRRFTARTLAAKAKVDPAYLSQIETGKKPGSVKALKALARVLGVDLQDVTP